MNDFRVILESTFKFKEEKLYLMLLRENGMFGVELVDRKKTFGRKYTKDRKQADLLFDEISNRLSEFKSLHLAEEFIKDSFKTKSIDKLLFIIMANGKTITQNDIVKMKDKVNFNLKLKFDFERKVKKKDALTIYVYEKRLDKKPFGVMVGTTNGDDLKFELV